MKIINDDENKIKRLTIQLGFDEFTNIKYLKQFNDDSQNSNGKYIRPLWTIATLIRQEELYNTFIKCTFISKCKLKNDNRNKIIFYTI